MGFEIKTAKAVITNGSNSAEVTIRFNDQIQRCIVGITGFQMAYTDNDHHVKNLGITVSRSSINNNEITCKVDLCLKDDSEHQGSGSAEICVAALTGVDNGDYVLQSGLKHEDSFEKGHGNAQISTVGLCSFGLSFSDKKDHHVKKITMGVSDLSNTLGVNGSMEDGSKHTSALTDVQAASTGSYLGYFGKSDNLKITPFTLVNGGTTNFNGNIFNYGIIITGFETSFSDKDHHIKFLETGAKLNTNGLIEGIIKMEDSSGHRQAQDSKVSGYVISYQA